MITITEEMLADLRGRVMQLMSPKRFRHTVAVEEMVSRLCALFCPEETVLLRAAALLHDLTKECSLEEQLELCRRYGLAVRSDELIAQKPLHARTAPPRIAEEFPHFAHPTVLDAVRWHTTGRDGMTLTEKLLYLADYIDESRTFPSCVLLRRFFFGADPEHMDLQERLALLRDTLILSFDMTLKDLIEESVPISPETVQARNRLLVERQNAG